MLDGSRKTIAAGFPPNGFWVNAFAIANGHDLAGVPDVVDDMGRDYGSLEGAIAVRARVFDVCARACDLVPPSHLFNGSICDILGCR